MYSHRLPILAFSLAVFAQAQYLQVDEYDHRRDAAKDIREAVIEAARTKKHVLVEVGGKWCVWCRIMDEFFKQNSDLMMLRNQGYVLVKVNFSLENDNKETLSKYPTISGYPHLFVLDDNGKLLHSQNTAELEEGKSYNSGKFKRFLEKWTPRPSR